MVERNTISKEHQIKSDPITEVTSSDKNIEIDRDSELMLAIKAGDRRAFSVLFQNYVRPLHSFVSRFIGNHSITEELVQEIFIKVYRAAESYEPRGRFSTFLYCIATNHCLNELRRADYRTRFESIEQSNVPGSSSKIELPDLNNPGAEKLLCGRDLAHKIQDILLDLPDNQRAALLLHRIEGLSYQEIAEALDTSIGAVKSLIHRAKKTLQQQLEFYK